MTIVDFVAHGKGFRRPSLLNHCFERNTFDCAFPMLIQRVALRAPSITWITPPLHRISAWVTLHPPTVVSNRRGPSPVPSIASPGPSADHPTPYANGSALVLKNLSAWPQHPVRFLPTSIPPPLEASGLFLLLCTSCLATLNNSINLNSQYVIIHDDMDSF